MQIDAGIRDTIILCYERSVGCYLVRNNQQTRGETSNQRLRRREWGIVEEENWSAVDGKTSTPPGMFETHSSHAWLVHGKLVRHTKPRWTDQKSKPRPCPNIATFLPSTDLHPDICTNRSCRWCPAVGLFTACRVSDPYPNPYHHWWFSY